MALSGFSITATSNCNWAASTTDMWIAIVSANNGIGNGAIGFRVRENFTGSARQGTIAIGDYTYRLVQDAGLGASCNYSISPAFQSFPSSGGVGAIQVTSQQECAWDAVAGESWITITSNNVGIGNGVVFYSVDSNPGASGRNGAVVVRGKTFSVKQKGS